GHEPLHRAGPGGAREPCDVPPRQHPGGTGAVAGPALAPLSGSGGRPSLVSSSPRLVFKCRSSPWVDGPATGAGNQGRGHTHAASCSPWARNRRPAARHGPSISPPRSAVATRHTGSAPAMNTIENTKPYTRKSL